MTPGNEYFAFLNAPMDFGEVSMALAASCLVRERPHLRDEEAKAICADWLAAYHECRTRPT